MNNVLGQLVGLAPHDYTRRVPPSHPSWQRLLESYAAPPRAYHNLSHVLAVARHFAGVSSQFEARAAVFAAVLFHDAVYELGAPSSAPGALSNEQRSAALALECLSGVLSSQELDEVQRLIEATEHHTELAGTARGDLAYFLDCDLSILGAPREQYALYIENICKEYSHVPAVLFNAGRLSWLERMSRASAGSAVAPNVVTSRIFSTDYFEDLLGDSARANLSWELELRQLTAAPA